MLCSAEFRGAPESSGLVHELLMLCSKAGRSIARIGGSPIGACDVCEFTPAGPLGPRLLDGGLGICAESGAG
eukprot:495232-Alexandrium_andersonii.AAC.1